MISHQQLRQIVLHGSFESLNGHSTQSDVVAIYGEPTDQQRRKSEMIYFYPWADFVFNGGLLHQITIKPIDIETSDLMDALVADMEMELVDEVAPFFRCSKLTSSPQVLVNQSPADNMHTISITLVFDDCQSENTTLSIPISKELYNRLQEVSSDKRISIQDICIQAIKEKLQS